jgi:hypothetical protein
MGSVVTSWTMARVSPSGLFALYLLLGAAGDANAQRHGAQSSAAHGAAGQQSVTGTEVPVGTGGGPPAEQQPGIVPIGNPPEGLGDKARANPGQTGSTTRMPAVEVPREPK